MRKFYLMGSLMVLLALVVVVSGSAKRNMTAFEKATTGHTQGSIIKRITPAMVPNGKARKAAICWQKNMWEQWGTFPYQQRITDSTYWCADHIGGKLTVRTSNVTQGVTYCRKDGVYSFRTLGGVGQALVEHRVGGYFTCGLPGTGLGHSTNRWYEVVHTSSGAWDYLTHS